MSLTKDMISEANSIIGANNDIATTYSLLEDLLLDNELEMDNMENLLLALSVYTPEIKNANLINDDKNKLAMSLCNEIKNAIELKVQKDRYDGEKSLDVSVKINNGRWVLYRVIRNKFEKYSIGEMGTARWCDIDEKYNSYKDIKALYEYLLTLVK